MLGEALFANSPKSDTQPPISVRMDKSEVGQPHREHWSAVVLQAQSSGQKHRITGKLFRKANPEVLPQTY